MRWRTSPGTHLYIGRFRRVSNRFQPEVLNIIVMCALIAPQRQAHYRMGNNYPDGSKPGGSNPDGSKPHKLNIEFDTSSTVAFDQFPQKMVRLVILSPVVLICSSSSSSSSPSVALSSSSSYETFVPFVQLVQLDEFTHKSCMSRLEELLREKSHSMNWMHRNSSGQYSIANGASIAARASMLRQHPAKFILRLRHRTSVFSRVDRFWNTCPPVRRSSALSSRTSRLSWLERSCPTVPCRMPRTSSTSFVQLSTRSNESGSLNLSHVSRSSGRALLLKLSVAAFCAASPCAAMKRSRSSARHLKATRWGYSCVVIIR
mmetsp:Transcript_12727/g.28703  ORF Transcript_12727/g.28703 Transcript_12727/m.28703 type:complete len:317 (-) Transcript_12727:274-1224(-)